MKRRDFPLSSAMLASEFTGKIDKPVITLAKAKSGTSVPRVL